MIMEERDILIVLLLPRHDLLWRSGHAQKALLHQPGRREPQQREPNFGIHVLSWSPIGESRSAATIAKLVIKKRFR